jgi:DNA-directed RNA polymerase specialized sigma subunit
LAGVFAALDTFAPAQGDTFETYAAQHVKDAIIKALQASLNKLDAVDFTPKTRQGPPV